jgi:glycosyltransferase involved in cell wall biosynthesis
MKSLTITSREITVPVRLQEFKDFHGVTMCMVVMNEEKEIKECILHHKPYVDHIIMIDGGSSDRTIEIATPLVDEIILRKFDGHYSNQANRCFERVRTDWILLVDSDERFEIEFLKSIREYINQDEYDCFSFPRKNYVNGKYDEEHFPDYQDRLFRSYCRRVRPVHGEVVGVKKKTQLKALDGNFIIHKKSLDRHSFRNTMYTYFESTFQQELGEPGKQMEDTYNKAYPNLHPSNFTFQESPLIKQG